MTRTNYPALEDVQALINATPGLSGAVEITSPDEAQLVLDAVIAETEKRTQRQFIADTVDTVRYYDGSGTALLEIDPILSLSATSAFGSVQIAQPKIGKPRTCLINKSGEFCPGRQNIAVTGKFGYAALVPADIWQAIRGEAAIRLVRQGLFSVEGRVTEEKYGDESRKYELADADTLLWHAEYEAAIELHRVDQGRRRRRIRGSMID